MYEEMYQFIKNKLINAHVYLFVGKDNTHFIEKQEKGIFFLFFKK